MNEVKIENPTHYRTTISSYLSGEKCPENKDLSDQTIRVARTAEEVFGEVYIQNQTALHQQLISNSKIKNIVFPSVLGINLLPLLSGYSNLGINLLSTAALTVGFVTSIYIGVSTELHTMLSKDFEVITKFSNAFETFKNNPNENDVKGLFDEFQKVYNYTAKNVEILGDLRLFKYSGKIFLMDAVVTILQNKYPDSLLGGLWHITKTYSLDSGFSEPWRLFGIDNPSMECYEDYLDQKDKFSSIYFADQIIAHFKQIAKNTLETDPQVRVNIVQSLHREEEIRQSKYKLKI